MGAMGTHFLQALKSEFPLQILGVMNPYVAMMAKEVGYRALYISGAATANFAHGIPDTGLTTLENVLEEVKKISSSVDLSLLVDVDTGWNIPETVIKMEAAGASAIHIEDQIPQKKCGHLSDKQLITTKEMCSRIEQASQAKKNLHIMARTDSYTVEGLEKTIQRAIAYKQAGAEMLFAEAFLSLEDYQKLKEAIQIPLLANITEFGKTPLFTTDELASAQVDMVLYPLSIARAMNQAALGVMCDIKSHGTQKNSLDIMQTRQELYHFLKYRE